MPRMSLKMGNSWESEKIGGAKYELKGNFSLSLNKAEQVGEIGMTSSNFFFLDLKIMQ